MEKQKKTMKQQLDNANKKLRENISCICTVAEWAEFMGFDNTKSFSRLYRNKYGLRPKTVIIQTKLDIAISLLQNKPELSCYEIAQKIGKIDEKGLNFFFNTHLNQSPYVFRSKKN